MVCAGLQVPIVQNATKSARADGVLRSSSNVKDGSRDPDDEVRNNATRALGVLVTSNQRSAVRRRPDLLDNIRSVAIDSLRWLLGATQVISTSLEWFSAE